MRALLIVDLQNDFLPGGALPVPHGDEVIPIINKLQEQFELIVASKDWHPTNHVSFATQHKKKPGEHVIVGDVIQELWPVHCVQNTHGAEFPNALNTSNITHVILKGTDPDLDTYSAFYDGIRKRDTGLAGFLREKGVDELFVVGLATDYCVKHTVLDALDLDFDVKVIKEGCRAIGDESKALKELEQAGAEILSF